METVRVIQIRGRTPGGLTHKYNPGSLARGDGAVSEVFTVTPAGVEMSLDAAKSVRSAFPDDTRIVGVDDHMAQLSRKPRSVENQAVESKEAMHAQPVAVVAEVVDDPETPELPVNDGVGATDVKIDVSFMTVRELRVIATNRNIAGRSSMDKDELIAALS